MAVAKLVCGDCGHEVSPGDAFCSHCGARLGEPARAPAHAAPSPRDSGARPAGSARRCEVCGFVTTGTGTICEGCGAKLPAEGQGISWFEETKAEPTKPAAPVARQEKPRKQKEPGRRRRERDGKRRISTWQIVSGIVVVGVIAFLVYTEAANDKPRSRVPAPDILTSQQPPMTQNIVPLQQAADANPNDADAALHLANALQDNNLLSRAVGAYNKYLALVPGDPNARTDLGICYYQMALADSAHSHELFQHALDEMETAYKNNPSFQPAAYNLGIVNLHLAKVEEARGWFGKAEAIDKDSDLGKKAAMMIEKHAVQQ